VLEQPEKLFVFCLTNIMEEKMNTIRKAMIGVFAIAAVGILSPTMASARGGFHGGFHGGGFHGGGFHGGWGGAGLAAGAIGLGLGLAAAPYAYGYGYPYGYDSYAYYDGGCYLVRRWTPWGPRPVQVCD
jgi:hypothetical protein